MKSSKRLLERVHRWDEEALAEVYDTYAPPLYRYAYRRTGHAETAEEVVSATFHKFLVALKNGGGPTDNLSAWLYRVAHNLIVDGYRREPEQPPVNLDDAPPLPVGAQQEGELLREEDAARVRSALRMLTPLQQQVITLRFLEGLTQEETAEVIERSIGAVKALQHRGIKTLQRIMGVGDG